MTTQQAARRKALFEQIQFLNMAARQGIITPQECSAMRARCAAAAATPPVQRAAADSHYTWQADDIKWVCPPTPEIAG